VDKSVTPPVSSTNKRSLIPLISSELCCLLSYRSINKTYICKDHCTCLRHIGVFKHHLDIPRSRIVSKHLGFADWVGWLCMLLSLKTPRWTLQVRCRLVRRLWTRTQHQDEVCSSSLLFSWWVSCSLCSNVQLPMNGTPHSSHWQVDLRPVTQAVQRSIDNWWRWCRWPLVPSEDQARLKQRHTRVDDQLLSIISQTKRKEKRRL